MSNIDFERLRKDLINYYGTAMSSGIAMATADLIEVERASNEELIIIARRSGINLSNYTEDMER